MFIFFKTGYVGSTYTFFSSDILEDISFRTASASSWSQGLIIIPFNTRKLYYKLIGHNADSAEVIAKAYRRIGTNA